jgi:hypothetical protein
MPKGKLATVPQAFTPTVKVEKVKNLGDLANLPPSMVRTRPADRNGLRLVLRNGGEPLQAVYDTKLQKPHALSMRYRIPTKLERYFQMTRRNFKSLRPTTS